jgi:glycosyltransferase involved in cell wall biosynthesis
MKKVLIITYYWPPSGGSSVQRWLRFSGYLPEFGWTPVMYVPDNAQYPETDPTLEKEILPGLEIIRKPISEPYGFYRKFTGIGKKNEIAAGMTIGSKPSAFSSLKNDLSMWIRGNFFIPDARMFWIRPSVKFLTKYLRENIVDCIITTGPPHSLHLIGYYLNQRTKIPWVADFRDPWTSIDFYKELKLTRLADKKHHHLEKRILTTASHVIAVGENMQQEFDTIGAKNVSVITNGYDYTDIPKDKILPDKKFSILHIGTLSRTRNAVALWQALGQKAREDKNFAENLEIKLIGNVDFAVIRSIEESGLTPFLNRISYLTHPEAMKAQHKAQVLLLLINNSVNSKGILTGKFFEYLTANRPILLVGPVDGDAAKILRETGAGRIAGFEDMAGLRRQVDELYELYQQGRLTVTASGTEKYSRRELTRKLAQILDKIIEH